MDKDTDKKLDAILDAIKGLDARITKIEADPAGADVKMAAHGSAKKLSICEFLLKHPPTADVQRTLAVGYYLETHEGMGSFTRADLEKGYRDAKHSLPSNMSMNIKHCIKAGNMMEGKEKKDNKPAYVVTSTGEQFVESGYKKQGTTNK
jgi:hypothetical protein